MAASRVRTESTAARCWLSARARSTRSASTWSSTRRTSPFSAHPPVSPRASTNGRACFNRRSGSRLLQVLAAAENLELVPAILRPRVLVVSLGQRPFFAVRHGLDAAAIDAVTDDVLLGRRRAPVTERLVVVKVDHRREQSPHCLRGLSERRERIRDLLLATPFGFLAILRLAFRPRDRFCAQPVGLSCRVRVDAYVRGRRLRLLAAARGHGRHGETAQQEQG